MMPVINEKGISSTNNTLMANALLEDIHVAIYYFYIRSICGKNKHVKN